MSIYVLVDCLFYVFVVYISRILGFVIYLFMFREDVLLTPLDLCAPPLRLGSANTPTSKSLQCYLFVCLFLLRE